MEENKQLKRTLNPIQVWSVALGSIIGWGAFVMPGDYFLPTAGPLGTAIGMGIGAIIMIVLSFNYGYLVTKIPLAGGEFSYTMKVFGKKHAYVCGWFLSLAYLSIVPLNATALGLIGRYVFPGVLQQGYLYTIAGWDVYLGEVLLASIAIIIVGLLSIKGSEISGIIQTGMTFLLVGSVFVLAIIMIISDKSQMINLKPYFSPNNESFYGVFSIVAITPWSYIGFGSIPQSAEEFRFDAHKATSLMILSIIFGYIIYIIMNCVTASVFPWVEFISSQPFWATGTAVKELVGNIGLVLLVVAILTAVMSGIIGFYMSTSRLFLSMARESLLPPWFSEIKSDSRTPSNSILFIMIVSLITPWFGRQILQWIVDMSSIGAAIGYLYTAITAFAVQKKLKANIWYKFFSLLGIVFSLMFITLLLIPGMPGSLSLPSYLALIIWIFLGCFFYFISNSIKKIIRR